MIGNRLLGICISLALLALAVAMAVAGYAHTHPAWWEASISLAVLGGVLPMILAVNSRIVPVFSRRDWVDPRGVQAMVVLAIASGWVVFIGRIDGNDGLVTLGSAIALVAGLLFLFEIGQIFRRGRVVRPAPPLPYPEQAAADRIATRFTRLSVLWLLAGLVVGFAVSIHTPETGRWELVWAHIMLVGFAFCMASGVTYHVLPRWTTGRWRSITALRIHWYVTVVALPLMVVALAIDSQVLFHMAAPLQAMVIVLWIGNCLPFVRRLPHPANVGMAAALGALTVGIFLGMSFAVTPANGALLRPVHAELNLFGWAALLIAGITYYFAPRFAGSPLRWRPLIPLQLGLTIGSLALSVALLWLRIEGHDAGPAVGLAHVGYALGIGLESAIVAVTFLFPKHAAVAPLQLVRRPPVG